MKKSIGKMNIKPAAVAFTLIVLAVGAAHASNGGSGGGLVQELYDFMKNSLEGVVGKSIAIGGLAYGLISGIAKGSMGGLGTGVGLAAAAVYGPKVIDTLVSATL